MDEILRTIFENGAIWGILGAGAFFLFIGILRALIQVTSPNKILVITGRKKVKGGRKFGFSVEKGRALVLPYLQQIGYLDLGVLPINVQVEGVNSANGITVGADATACVCINDDDEPMLYSAVERLMGKSRDEIQEQIKQTLVGNFRGALNKATPLQAIGMEEVPDDLLGNKAQPAETEKQKEKREGERVQFRNELLKDINSDLASFGMKVVSVSLQKIWDKVNYIANLAQKTLAQKRKQVEIEESRLRSIAEQAKSDGERRIIVAKNQADEKIITARQRLEVYRQEAEAQIEQAKLEADSAVQEAQNRGERQIQEQIVELQKLENFSKIILQAEAGQKAAEIIASGEQEAVNITESTKNNLLAQKQELLDESGDTGKMVIFAKQQLPHLFAAYKKYAETQGIDSLVIMDEKQGINGAVNRGPAAFTDFLKHFENALGINIKALLGQKAEKEDKA